MEIDRKWLSGICEFNAHFIVNKSNLCELIRLKQFIADIFLDNIKILFVILLPTRDIAILYRFKKFFKVGKIISDNTNCMFFVEKIEYHYNRIIKFFDGTKLLSSNRICYERYRYLVYKIYNKAVDKSNTEYLLNYAIRYAYSNDSLKDKLYFLIEAKKNTAVVKNVFLNMLKIYVYTLLIITKNKDKR